MKVCFERKNPLQVLTNCLPRSTIYILKTDNRRIFRDGAIRRTEKRSFYFLPAYGLPNFKNANYKNANFKNANFKRANPGRTNSENTAICRLTANF